MFPAQFARAGEPGCTASECVRVTESGFLEFEIRNRTSVLGAQTYPTDRRKDNAASLRNASFPVAFCDAEVSRFIIGDSRRLPKTARKNGRSKPEAASDKKVHSFDTRIFAVW